MVSVIGCSLTPLDSRTACEHIRRTGHQRRTPVSIHEDTFQVCTTLEHRRHVCHLPGVEGRQIEFRKPFTALKQMAHVSYILCLQIRQTLNLREVRATAEPICQTGQRGAVLQCRVDDDRCQRGLDGSPAGVF